MLKAKSCSLPIGLKSAVSILASFAKFIIALLLVYSKVTFLLAFSVIFGAYLKSLKCLSECPCTEYLHMCFWYMCILLYICICYPYIWTFVWIFLFSAILYWSCGHCACLYVKDTRKIFLIYNILGYIVLWIRDNIYAWLYIESFTLFLYM